VNKSLVTSYTLCCVTMSRSVLVRCSLWYKTGAFSRLAALTPKPLRHVDVAYRHSRSSKLHRRVINEHALKEQLDIMKMSIADLENADSFGSLGADCDVDDELRALVKADRRRKSVEPSSEMLEYSHISISDSDQQVAADNQEDKVSHQSSKHSRKRRISAPLKVSDKTSEHVEIYNKFSHKKSLPDVDPGHKDWSEKFGSLSNDVDKFLDKYVSDTSRYICSLIIYFT